MSLPEKCRQCGKLAFLGKTVTIPAEEYEELRRFKEARTMTVPKGAPRRLTTRNKVARDAELADYVLGLAETLTLAEVHTACVERFGKDRVPDRSTIGRFLNEKVGHVRHQHRPKPSSFDRLTASLGRKSSQV